MSKAWYVLKVQSGKEEQVRDSIEKRVKIEGLEDFFGQIIVPVEKVSEIARGKAYFTSTQTLGQYIMKDFLRGKRRRVG